VVVKLFDMKTPIMREVPQGPPELIADVLGMTSGEAAPPQQIDNNTLQFAAIG
jgi:hypothetical protein